MRHFVLIQYAHHGTIHEPLPRLPSASWNHRKQIVNNLNNLEKPPNYISLMLLSNLFFFLGFVLQTDGDDQRGYIPILFGHSIEPSDRWFYIANIVSLLSFLALIVSWVLLIDKDKWLYPLKFRSEPHNQ